MLALANRLIGESAISLIVLILVMSLVIWVTFNASLAKFLEPITYIEAMALYIFTKLMLHKPQGG